MRLLLIEDDPADAKLIQSVLRKIRDIHHECQVVPDLESATQALKDGNIDFIFTDYMLGARTGIDIYQELRKLGYELPIVMITGNGSDELALKAMRAGLDDFLCKDDINPSTLYRAILVGQAKHELRLQVAEKHRQVIVAERNRVMSHSLGATCHHISQPLTVIMANLDQLIGETDADPKHQQLIHQSLEAALRMSEILNAMRSIDDYRTVKYVEAVEILDLGLDKGSNLEHGT